MQPRVPTYGLRKTAHVFGAISVDEAEFLYRFAAVFNGHTFHEFLMQLVARYGARKIFLIIDNSPCHWLDEAGKAWLQQNADRIELHRLPPYSPEFNPTEGVWKTTRKHVTHNRFFATVQERDGALTAAFEWFRAEPTLLAGHVARRVGRLSGPSRRPEVDDRASGRVSRQRPAYQDVELRNSLKLDHFFPGDRVRARHAC